MVQLFPFAIDPFWPGVKFLELVTSEAAEGLFSRCDGLGLDGIQQDPNLLRGDSLLGEVELRETDSSDGTDVRDRENGSVVIIRRQIGFVEVTFPLDTLTVSCSEAAFRGIFDFKGGHARIVAMSEGSNSVVLGEDGDVVDASNVGTFGGTEGGLVG